MWHWELIDWIGALGGAVLLFAFARISLGLWKSTSLWYELDNFVAAVLLGVYTLRKGAIVSALINVIWAIVALKGVTSLAERRRHHRARKVQQS